MPAKAKSEPAPWSEVVLICAKCAAKLGRGCKGKTELRGEIKHALKRRGLRKTIQVVETTCLDLCPKNGQALATRRLLADSQLAVVGANADGEAVVDLLFGGVPSQEAATSDRIKNKETRVAR